MVCFFCFRMCYEDIGLFVRYFWAYSRRELISSFWSIILHRLLVILLSAVVHLSRANAASATPYHSSALGPFRWNDTKVVEYLIHIPFNPIAYGARSAAVADSLHIWCLPGFRQIYHAAAVALFSRSQRKSRVFSCSSRCEISLKTSASYSVAIQYRR